MKISIRTTTTTTTAKPVIAEEDIETVAQLPLRFKVVKFPFELNHRNNLLDFNTRLIDLELMNEWIN